MTGPRPFLKRHANAVSTLVHAILFVVIGASILVVQDPPTVSAPTISPLPVPTNWPSDFPFEQVSYDPERQKTMEYRKSTINGRNVAMTVELSGPRKLRVNDDGEINVFINIVGLSREEQPETTLTPTAPSFIITPSQPTKKSGQTTGERFIISSSTAGRKVFYLKVDTTLSPTFSMEAGSLSVDVYTETDWLLRYGPLLQQLGVGALLGVILSYVLQRRRERAGGASE